jgi:GR25 family glycosyltransferase involved in LPS biosynthesis
MADLSKDVSVVYINLDRSIARKEQLLSALNAQNLGQWALRQPGIEEISPSNGLSHSEYGCLISHIQAIKRGDGRHVLVLEDDVCISSRLAILLPRAIDMMCRKGLDLLLLGQTVDFRDVVFHASMNRLMRELQATRRLMVLEGDKFYRWGSFAYIVNKDSTNKVLDAVGAALSNGDVLPIDRILKKKITESKIKAGVIFPYLVGVHSEMDSTMHDRGQNHTHWQHASLVNTYLLDATMKDERAEWTKVLSSSADTRALAVARQIFYYLSSKK